MKKRAQSAVEYVVVIGVVAMALIAMATYMKRGIQGKARSDIDQLSGGTAYAPGETVSDSVVSKKIVETSKSYSVQVPDTTSDDEQVNVSDSTIEIDQSTNRQEEVLPYK
jgi:Tfp pilus assembly protein FimT